ncbi:MAG: calcium/sodium antiporter [Gammaproteobacteria bacterium]|nr:MAG: calcium/sodium antiporter [Gammaproteobacteria bacterium]RLA53596.1 MAG: calcium/sodium antiporter [Gammaproteobacteria bacterium]
MSGLIPASGALIIGLIGLVWGADRFIIAAASSAKKLGISPIVIGLTIVAFGTSAPEVIVSVNAALQDAGELAIGNALGSNLANIGLVLGITALVAPMPAQRHLVSQEGPALILVTILTGLCLYNARLGRAESILMLLVLPLLLWATIKYKKAHPDQEEKEFTEEIIEVSTRAAIVGFLVGLITMLLASRVLVWGAKIVAFELGMSELVIGLTVLAIGTSLPELAASVAGALRGHHDIAIGNVFGSNMFNFLLVMPIAGVISPLQLEPMVFFRDYLAVCLFTIALVGTIAFKYRRNCIETAYLSRRFGLIMIATYFTYFIILVPTS